MDLVCCLSFRAGVYGTKTGLFSRKIKFVILACSPASIAAAHCRRKNAQFFFTSQRQRANTSVFFEICGFLLYWDLVLYLSFRAGIYGTKTGLFSRKIKFVIFACSFASIAAALRRLWGRVPFSLVNSVRFMRRRPINSRSGKLL